MVNFCLVGDSELCEDVLAPDKDSADTSWPTGGKFKHDRSNMKKVAQIYYLELLYVFAEVDVTEEFLESIENEKHIQTDGI
ncbi:5240_t:CDS:2 [Dentiscutata heterogama]|uniref:5240_t:CDS:1 n=1 Tax=Dentiscutata heterogama TaxID=1316150 RepID=A0ACA9LUG8_9GLOM|nr:5240_t:CDS:2 [Dentiscutata heterogama]